MLRLNKVRKEYKGFQLDCTLEVQEGCVTGLIGKNGAGKSTTFKAILGLLKMDGGSIEILGKPLHEIGNQDKEDMGVVMSDAGFSGYLMIQDLIPVLKNMYRNFQEEEFRRKCKKFQLPMNKKIKEFSTGMKRKLQVLAALSHEARLLLLDEPTAGLDIIARDELLDMLRTYMEKEGRAILVSSHISSDLEGLCDDIYMIDDGKIILYEETDVLLDCYGILKATPEQFGRIEREHILRYKKEGFGYSCLTDQRQFYQENYPDIAVEKGNIDELIMMMIRGEE
ncbi:ATP-binding cassette domain-containing protein [Lachnospiraceae bacterium WCA-9-b2]|uniref:ATP-binding cassette domain-containing protein n=1 Tax=Sporofaciens musculi TaxID=2681861 RepID=A0A7X3MF73_9FIRM|nr:ABC transporter ATP-binding protein [Sporofaciens musculi]MCI9423193.1 ABC transporter ATP-binding protein [Dorea sp.]MXP75232.1 ATP-binding cassette domain-containing protein [Sporofaciens musculi]